MKLQECVNGSLYYFIEGYQLYNSLANYIKLCLFSLFMHKWMTFLIHKKILRTDTRPYWRRKSTWKATPSTRQNCQRWSEMCWKLVETWRTVLTFLQEVFDKILLPQITWWKSRMIGKWMIDIIRWQSMCNTCVLQPLLVKKTWVSLLKISEI